MPLDALPERLQSYEAWQGTDLDKWYSRWILKYIHGWFAYGPRAKEWWACWDAPPKTILKLGGRGPWRYETDPMTGKRYLSRIQYWKRWHFQIQWPFLLAFHIYFKDADTLPVGLSSGASADNKLFYFYTGAHFDQDSVYWFPSAFLGLTWK